MVSRRLFMAGGTAAATLAVTSRAFAQWQPSQRYPDPAIQIVDQSFARYRVGATKVGTPDGMRCDVDGNLWCAWGMGQEGLDGVSIFNPDGKLIGRINLPERCANLCFGGTYRNRLFMAASTSLYHLYVNAQGAIGG